MDLNPNTRPDKIGVITHGSLNKGVEMKLDAAEAIESIVAGTFTVVEGDRYDFFSMITDVEISATNENILLHPPPSDNDLLRRVLQGSGTYATVALKPMLMMPNHRGSQEFEEAMPVKTVPSHFSPVAKATEEDVARVFGHEANDGGDRYFHVGEPIGMQDIPVCVDLARLVERSNAVFGKTGTGKTFLTRLLLCGTIKTGRAVNLVFDMHSEYGWNARQESGDRPVLGLKKLFPGKVTIFSLDPKGTRNRGVSPDHEVYLYADQIEPADILPLRDTLNLTATAAESTYSLQSRYKKQWLTTLLHADAERLREIAEECGAHEASISALQRKLKQFAGYGFFKTDSSRGTYDVIEALTETLDSGKSVVFEFGKYDDLRVYLLAANVITRRLRDRYEEKTTTYLRSGNEADKPRPLIITIEEAHKFLAPGIAHETPFGKIAREMRKFFVSLLVVDQRPSAIDEEVLSQIGTKIVAQLNDEKDIGAALVGTSGASALRQVLASLDSKQQALILGHAVPMPIVVKTRTYDETFYKAMRGDGANGAAESFSDIRKQMNELF